MVNLKVNPYYLNDSQIKWVDDTIASMTIEEKAGQLFIGMVMAGMDQVNLGILQKYHIGGTRYNPGKAKDIYDLNKFMQDNSKIPLLIASNIEAGGDGCCIEGTNIAPGILCGASMDPSVSYDMGYVGGVESSAVGCNWCFAPVVDIAFNWRNTVIQTRAFGDNADIVISHGKEFFKAVSEQNMAACIKHFPGDGVDERDQHVVTSHNTMSCEEWDNTFGKVYEEMIKAGVQSVMIGHIGLPEYSRKLCPGIVDSEILPATLAKEIATGLLRERLGFNGLAITDASAMLGLTSQKTREDLVPGVIAAGCDMLLFMADPEEDFSFMLNGIKNGIITEERLSDALHRILGVKASLNLHEKQANGTLSNLKNGLDVIGCDIHMALASKAADKGITLVKDTLNILPVRPETHKRAKVIVVEQPALMPGHSKGGIRSFIKEELEAVGFEVYLQKTITELIAESGEKDNTRLLFKKPKTKDFEAAYDVVF